MLMGTPRPLRIVIEYLKFFHEYESFMLYWNIVTEDCSSTELDDFVPTEPDCR